MIGPVERFARFVSWALPVGLALVRTSPHAQWRGDVAAVRDLGLAGVGWGGGVSTVLAQVVSFLPIGTLTYRTALASALLLGLACYSLFHLALRMLRAAEAAHTKSGEHSVFAAPLLAALATLTAGMTPAFQCEATVGGSTMLAASIALAAVERAVSAIAGAPIAGESTRRPMARIIGWGFALGAVTAENAVAGLAACAACLVAAILATRRAGGSAGRPLVIPMRVVRGAVLAGLFALALFSAPSILRVYSPHAALDLGGPYLWGAALPPDLSAHQGPLAAWSDEIGVMSLGLAAFGGLVLAATRSRALLAPLLVFVAADAAVRSMLGATEGTIALRLLSVASISSASTVGVYALVRKIQALRVPLARPGAAMLVAFHATLVGIITEQAAGRADRASQAGASAFTSAALEELPMRSTILVDSPLVAWRLLAAQLVEGRRADVLVVPRRLLDRGDVAASLLTEEPATEPLLRAIALEGVSDEVGLSSIADRRPLFVEAEGRWDDLIYRHITLAGPWLRFETEPLGKADRLNDLDAAIADVGPLVKAAATERGDVESLYVAATIVTKESRALVRLGLPADSRRFLAEVSVPEIDAVHGGGDLGYVVGPLLARLRANDPKAKRAANNPRPLPPPPVERRADRKPKPKDRNR
ncbi:MAG: hypothetical protein U0271_17330 [Polyangiaceae bacterium]